MKWLISVVVLGISVSAGAVCTPNMSHDECVARQVASQKAGAEHRIFAEFTRRLARVCTVDVDTQTVACVPPPEWLTLCDGSGCVLEVDLR